MEASEFNKLTGKSLYNLMKESHESFIKQVDEDFDSIKNKLGIETKNDPKIQNLSFTYRAGVLRGVMEVAKHLNLVENV